MSVRTLSILLSSLLLTSLLSLGCSKRNLDTVGQADNPFVLLLSPSHAEGAPRISDFQAALSQATGLTITVRVASSEDEAISIAGTTIYDAGLLPLFDYIFCRQEYGVTAGLQLMRMDQRRTHTGVIVSPASSEITQISQLAGQPVGFVDYYSTSGFLYPIELLRNAEIEPNIVFLHSHPTALAALNEGRVVAATTFAQAVDGNPDYRVIARTREIPHEPIFFRANLNPTVQQSVIDGLLQLTQSDEGRQILESFTQITGFTPVTNSYYDEVCDLIRAAGHRIQDLVPSGWRIHNLNLLQPSDFAH